MFARHSGALSRERILRGARWAWRHRLLISILITTSVFTTEFALLKIPKANAAYTIANSARFISGNSDDLSKTLTTPTDTHKFTFSTWVKLGSIPAAGDCLFSGGTGTTYALCFNGSSILAGNANVLEFLSSDGAATVKVQSNNLFRDPAAWMHVVLAVDTTQATAANRVRIYVNGVEVSYLSTTYPPQNASVGINTANAHRIGSWIGAVYHDGYMSDAYLIDGAQLAPTCFGATDSNGYWRPITYSTASPCAAYGTNGFHLAFGNGNALGTDTGSTNNFATSTNFAITDQVTDSPTNSFATLSPLDVRLGTLGAVDTLTSGNLVATGAGGLSDRFTHGTIAPASGKWYYEATITSLSGAAYVGVRNIQSNLGNLYVNDGTIYKDGVSQGVIAATYTTGDVIGVAWDADSSTIKFYKNNSLQTTQTSLTTVTNSLPTLYTGSNSVVTFNFGQGGQSGLTFDSASGGTFKYTPPSGYKALSTANLPVPTIAVPKNYFDAGLYTGWGAAQTITAVATKRIFLTSGTSFTVPSDWNSSNNSIEVIGGGGGGGGGGAGSDGTSGGGGAYSKALNVSLTAGGSVAYAVGAGGFGGAVSSAGTTGGDTYFCNSASNCASISGSAVVAGAKGGVAGNNGCGGGSGGSSASGIGSTKYSGGSGGCGVSPTVAGGAGGAAGPNGAGNGNSSSAGGSGDSGIGGAGGAAGSAGNVGKEWIDMTGTIAGSGGGAGGGSSATGPAGGAYGGGGGGGVISPGNTVGGAGAQGIIVVTYTPSGIGFTPDLVWIKDRTSANAHGIFDAVRTGSTNTLFSYTGASQSFVVPAGVTSINFKAWGAGGGGGGGAGAVGGAGGYVNATSIAVTPGESLTVNVGGGGQTSINQASWQGAGGGMTSLLRGSTLLAVAAAGGGSSFGGPGGDGGGTTGSGGTSPNGGGGTQSAGGSAGTGATAGSAGQGGRAASGVATDSVGGYNGGAAGDGDNSTWTSGGGGGGYFGGGGGGNNSGGGNGGGGSSYYGASGSTSQGSGTTAPQTSDVDYPGGTVGKGGAVKGNGGNGYAVISYSDAASHPYWSSNANTAETNSATALTSFLTNGFSLGTQALFNTSGNNYISWLWKKSPTTDGVDIVTYTGTGAAHTIAHNLGAVPDMIIVKRRDTIGDAAVYHTSQAASPQNNFMLLDSTAATAADSTYWNNTAPTASVFTVGTNANVDANTGTYVAYLFKAISGFSAFGAYTGNSSADGPFIYTGFKPRYVMIKRTDSATSWYIFDTARSATNPATLTLLSDAANAESSSATIDILSNGFKLRANDGINAGNFVYAAFADVPFYYSAQPAASFVSNSATTFLMGMTF